MKTRKPKMMKPKPIVKPKPKAGKKNPITSFERV